MASADWMNQLNKNYLHSIGSDGRYNRDRMFESLNIRPNAKGVYDLSGSQQQQMKQLLEQELGQKLDGATIDTAGNVNEPEGFKHYAKKYGPIAGGIALTAFGIPGVMPGLIGGGGAAAGGASAASSATGATGGGGMWSSILSGLKGIGKNLVGGAPGTGGGAGGWTSQIGNIMDLAGAGLGARSSAQASNRGTALEAQTDIAQQLALRDKYYNDALLAYEKEGREGGAQAMRQLLTSQRMNNPAERPNVSPYAAPQRQATDIERQANDLMAQQMMARLQGGNPLPRPEKTDLQIDRSLMKPSTSENVTGWLSALMPVGGRVLAPRPQPPIMTQSGLWQETQAKPRT